MGARHPQNLKAVSSWLKIPFDKLRIPCFRHAELIHSQQCAIWYYRLKNLFPNAQVLREHEFFPSKTASDSLISGETRVERRPDLLVIHPGPTKSGYAVVGVEIERFIKSKARLLKKLDKYASKTKLDGVIYVCENDAIARTLRRVYKSKIVERAIRVSHYGNHFILFLDGQMDAKTQEPIAHNIALQRVSFRNWMHLLSQTQMSQRRDHHFVAPGCLSSPEKQQ